MKMQQQIRTQAIAATMTGIKTLLARAPFGELKLERIRGPEELLAGGEVGGRVGVKVGIEGAHVGLTVGPVHRAMVESIPRLVKFGKDTCREAASNTHEGEHVMLGFEFSSNICKESRLQIDGGKVPEKRFCCS